MSSRITKKAEITTTITLTHLIHDSYTDRRFSISDIYSEIPPEYLDKKILGIEMKANKDMMVIELNLLMDSYYNTTDESKSDPELNLGTIIKFGSNCWLVVHKTDTECYLLQDRHAYKCKFDNLPNKCKMAEKHEFGEDELACMKTMTVTNISGKVFVATYDQMNGGFDYFNGDNKRDLNSEYWTSTTVGTTGAWAVCSNGSLDIFSIISGNILGFRPCICLDIEKYKEYVDVHNK